VKMPPTDFVQIVQHQGRYVIWRIKALSRLLLAHKMVAFRHFVRGFWAIVFPCVFPATLFGALCFDTLLPRPPLRYLAQTATLSGANRYVIWRKLFQEICW